MKTRSVIGIILIGLGIVTLAYFASPMRLLFQSPAGPQRIDPLPPVLGGLALVCGIVLVFGAKRDE
jgi:uncharacterized membrane protein